jgi:UDP-3-O-[3-hydroxymyristoyl] glucosamine N-acyltransferase
MNVLLFIRLTIVLNISLEPAISNDTSHLLPSNLLVNSPVSVSVFITQPGQYTLRANSLPTYLLLNQYIALLAPEPKKHPSSKTGSKTSVGQDSLVAANCTLGERVQIRRSILSSGVVVASRSMIRGSVVMEGVAIGEKCPLTYQINGSAKLEGCVVCRGAKIGEKVSLTDCFVGAGFHVEDNSKLFMNLLISAKMARQNLVELEELEDDESEEDDWEG